MSILIDRLFSFLRRHFHTYSGAGKINFLEKWFVCIWHQKKKLEPVRFGWMDSHLICVFKITKQTKLQYGGFISGDIASMVVYMRAIATAAIVDFISCFQAETVQ